MKLNIIILMLTSLTLTTVPAEKVSCAYPDSEKHEMVLTENCGELDSNGLLVLSPGMKKKVNWSKYGLECAHISGSKNQDGWYFISQSGRGRLTPFTQNNDCYPFEEGLTVGISKGHIIFYNQIFEIVKITDYIWASGFYKGYAKVCTGELKKVYPKGGEYYSYEGGQCGYIDRSFNVVIPLKYTFEKTPEPK